MKVLSTTGLTKLIELIKSGFISVDDTETTTEIDTVTTSEVTLATVATSGSYNDLLNKPDLSAKADVDLSNCTKPHIVETYVNGSSWYRIYSDGWCEQGLTKSGDSSEWKTFLKPFADTNYNVQVTATGSSGLSAQDWAYVGAYPLYREATRVYIRPYNQTDAIAYIYACGYIN